MRRRAPCETPGVTLEVGDRPSWDKKGVFAEKGARFRGKRGLATPPPPQAPRPRPPFLLGGGGGVLLKIPGGGGSSRRGGGEGRARGVYGEFGGGGRKISL